MFGSSVTRTFGRAAAVAVALAFLAACEEEAEQQTEETAPAEETQPAEETGGDATGDDQEGDQ